MKNTRSIVGIVTAMLVWVVSLTVWGVPPPPTDAIHYGGRLTPTDRYDYSSPCNVSGATCCTMDYQGLLIKEAFGQAWRPIAASGTSIRMYVNSNSRWSCNGNMRITLCPSTGTVGTPTGQLTIAVAFSESARNVSTASISFIGSWTILYGSGACSGWTGGGEIYASGTYDHSSGGSLPNYIHFPENRVVWSDGGFRMVGKVNKTTTITPESIQPQPFSPEYSEFYSPGK